MKNSCTGLGFASLLAALALQPVDAHSWAEMLKRIAPNGTMVGAPGYMRGYASRATAGFSDTMDTFLIPPNGRPTGNKILSTDSLCHPSQTIGNYSAMFPKLSAAAGDYVAIRYQENGHVTLPDINPTKPLNRGTVYIYGTDKPAADEKFLDVFQQWTADGTGGNGRGRLLATRNFDDGQCYQVNQNTISQQRQAEFSKVAEDPQGTDLWCQNDLQLPTDLASGSMYTLYWVWSWPTFDKAGAPTDIAPPGYTITTNQFYTSCIDIDVTASDDGTPATTSNQVKSKGGSIAASFLHGQDLNSAAVFSQLAMGAFEVAVPGSGSNGSGAAPSAGGSGSGSGSGSSSSTATTASPTTTHTHGSGPETIVVTVTTTEAPVYVTITVPASSSGSDTASAAPTTTSSSSSSVRKTHTHVTTVYDHATVTETVSMMPSSSPSSSSSSSSSSSTSSFSRTPRQRSTRSTVSTTTDSGSRTPTVAPTVQPFLNGTSIIAGPARTTLLRVPRYRRRA